MLNDYMTKNQIENLFETKQLSFRLCEYDRGEILNNDLSAILTASAAAACCNADVTRHVPHRGIIVICLASVLMAVNIKTFVKAGGLYPGGATGLTVLIQSIFERFLNMEIPYSLVNLLLNLVPIYIGFRFIGKKFTLYSCLMIVLTSVLTDIIPQSAPALTNVLILTAIRTEARQMTMIRFPSFFKSKVIALFPP